MGNRCLAALLLVLLTHAVHSAPNYVSAPPLSEVVRTPPGAVAGEELRVPVITWGGDIATLLANGNATVTQPGSHFAKAGLQVRLGREDVFARQVERFISGESAFLRGTLGMINMTADLLAKDPRTRPIVIHQMTWSAGGDALVVKEGIRSAADLKGRTVALQAYGPHVVYLGKILADAGLSLDDVTIKWLPDLTGSDNTPMNALHQADIDAAFVITPDAIALTSGGNIGTGAEASVKGARILLSTKTANRIIADVYAVRADFFEANRDKVQAFVTALLNAQSELKSLVSNRRSAPAPYRDVLRAAGEVLLDSPEAVADVEGLYADCEFVGFSGNVDFFSNDKYPRRFDRLNGEISSGLSRINLAAGASVVKQAKWDWRQLETGVAATAQTAKPRFNTDRVAELVTRKQQQGALQEGELFRFEVFFKPNQKTFAVDLYRDAFERVIDLASTYGGAIITIEGHSDPLGYLRKKKEQAPSVVLGQIKQSARNLSIGRAQSVRDTIIDYANTKSVSLDPTQFAVVGHGIAQPRTGTCGRDPCAPKNEKQWRSNMRVEFRILQVEAESQVFKAL